MFGFHPVNLAFRFLLEVAALLGLGFGMYALASGALAWVLAIAVPLGAAVVWGTFNVPGDASRSGEAPVAVPGAVRLLIELGVFGSSILVLWFASPAASAVLAVGVAVHYLLSLDRVKWLLTGSRGSTG